MNKDVSSRESLYKCEISSFLTYQILPVKIPLNQYIFPEGYNTTISIVLR